MASPSQTSSRRVRASRKRFSSRLRQGVSADSYQYLFEDARETLGFPNEITPEMYRERFDRGGIANTLITLLAEKMWRKGIQVYDTEDPDTVSEFEASWEILAKRLLPALLAADILAGIYEYSVILVGLPSSSNDLSIPATKITSPGEILYLSPMGQDRALIHEEYTDLNSPLCGQPKIYKLYLSENNKNVLVHHSRIIHIARNTLEDSLRGAPDLESIWNLLINLDRVVDGGSLGAWTRGIAGLHIDLDPELQLSPEAEEEFSAAVDDFVYGTDKVLTSRGATLKAIDSEVAEIGPNSQLILSLIAGTKRIPVRILTGSERGELASSSDEDNVNEAVRNREDRVGTPLLQKSTEYFVRIGALPAPVGDGEVKIFWPELSKISPEKRSNIVLNLARANATHQHASGELLLTTAEFRDEYLNLEPSDDLQGVSGSGTADEPVVTQQSMQSLLAKNEPHWKVIHRVAEDKEESFAKEILRIWASAGKSLTIDLESPSKLSDQIQEGLDTVASDLAETLPEMLSDVVISAGKAAAKKASKSGYFMTSDQVSTNANSNGDHIGISQFFTLSFDSTNDRILAWAQARAGALITELSDDIRAGIRDLIVQAAKDGISPKVLQKIVRQSVGLRTDQIRAIQNLITELRSAQPGYLVTRFNPQLGLRIKAGFSVKIPRNGLTPAEIAKAALRYQDMQLNYRARTIGRTETLRAANEGQVELWRQGVDDGSLPKEVKRVWIATVDERLRDSHAAMNGQETTIDGKFDPSIEPGEEVNCRCGQGLVSGK